MRKTNPSLDDSTMFQSISQGGGDKSISGAMGDLSESLGEEKLEIEAEADDDSAVIKKPKMTALDNLRCCLFCN
jgi:hypothetical protein